MITIFFYEMDDSIYYKEQTYLGYYVIFSFSNILAYVYIPIVQRELDDFKTMVWNNNRGRKQANKALPNGNPPAVIYEFPEECDGTYTDHGIQITDSDFNDLGKIDELVPLFAGEHEDYIPSALRQVLDDLVQDVGYDHDQNIKLENAQQVYKDLRKAFKAIV